MRARLFQRQPLCEHCEQRGVVKPATQRDHRISLGEGGSDNEDNEQALCDECHEVKSAQERMRAQTRSRL